MSYICEDVILSKTVADPVHGYITLHPLCVAIIDTAQYQRLRHIKQNGLVHYVYPAAVHNRFCHSLGVSYLAGCFMRQLRDRQPSLGITDLEILCIEIAGLCHDLGHGPLSHSWEMFVKSKGDKTWKHETVSSNLFDYLIEANDLEPLMLKWGINEERRNFIKRIIRGEVDSEEPRRFLYQIVNNEESGLDVDKWDYFLRDSYYLGFQINFDYRWLMQFARVVDVDGYQRICFRDKEVANVYGMFRTRSYLHHTAYKHRVVTLIEQIVFEVLCEADEQVVDINRQVMQLCKWSVDAAQPRREQKEFATRMEHFCSLTDDALFYAIANCRFPVAEKFLSIENGRAFKNDHHYVGSCWIDKQLERAQVENDFLQFISKESLSMFENFEKKIFFQIIVNHWGKGERNPVDSVWFYSKDQPNSAYHIFQESVSSLVPRVFQEIELRLFCADSEKLEMLKKYFSLYCENTWGKKIFYK